MTSTTTSAKATKPHPVRREPKPAATAAIGKTSSSDADAATRPASRPSATRPPAASKPDKPASKASVVLAMLQQPEGATLDQMVAATGWLPHTTRAVLTRFKKKGHVVASDKVGGVRTYRVASAGTEAARPPADTLVVTDA